MRKYGWVCLALLMGSTAVAENYVLTGRQVSRITYQLVQRITPDANTRKLMLSYVIPESFDSPTYRQQIVRTDLRFNPPPADRMSRTDPRGNQVVEANWSGQLTPVTATIHVTAETTVDLKKLHTRTPFPLPRLPDSVKTYLQPTRQVASDDAAIRTRAEQLTSSAATEFDAVQKILTWIVDHLNYIVNPPNYDALYSLSSGRGNCQNYSHLAAALMRAVGIPVRIVNGIVLKKPYDIQLADTILTMKMAEGRHSWIEVFFPDLGWVPFDPSGTEMFVSSRFIRIEIGLDNNETRQDGLIRWSYRTDTPGTPAFVETIEAGFDRDEIDVAADKTDYGPLKLLLCPRVESDFTRVRLAYRPQPPPALPPAALKQLQYTQPYVFGNLDFPADIDFLSTRGPARPVASGTLEMRKNFLVETAEYVTTQGRQYAQMFVLEKPMRLESVALALHKFGGDGQMWLELLRDRRDTPGEPLATSGILDVAEMRFTPGYSWIDFDFAESGLVLPPGRYWIALGFTGSPVVNWFFSYGKPVGPQEGTRYRTLFDRDWSRSLAYEFNYRVKGFTGAP